MVPGILITLCKLMIIKQCVLGKYRSFAPVVNKRSTIPCPNWAFIIMWIPLNKVYFYEGQQTMQPVTVENPALRDWPDSMNCLLNHLLILAQMHVQLLMRWLEVSTRNAAKPVHAYCAIYRVQALQRQTHQKKPSPSCVICFTNQARKMGLFLQFVPIWLVL